MSWLAVGAAVASAVVSGVNQRRTAKKQDQEAARGIAEQAKLQREANARLNQNLDKLETSTPKDEYTSRSGQIRDQLRKQQSMALAGIQNTGGGDAVTEMANAARPQAVEYGDQINSYLSGIDAPLLQRQGEGFDNADLGSYLDRIRRDSSQAQNLTNLRMQGIRPSPWLDMLSTGLSAYSGAKGFGGGTMAGAASSPVNPMISQASAANMPFNQVPLQGNPFGIGSIFGNGRIGG